MCVPSFFDLCKRKNAKFLLYYVGLKSKNLFNVCCVYKLGKSIFLLLALCGRNVIFGLSIVGIEIKPKKKVPSLLLPNVGKEFF